MKLLITLSLLLVAVCAAPSGIRSYYPISDDRFPAVRNADRDSAVSNGNGGSDLSLRTEFSRDPSEDESKGDLTRTERFMDLLKGYIEFLRQQFALSKRIKKKLGILAISILTGDDDFEEEVEEIFAGGAGRLVNEFIHAVQNKGSRFQSAVQFFKEEYGQIVVQMMIFLGADGKDLPSVAAYIVKGTFGGFLKVFALKLKDSESDAISGAISGLGKTIATIFTEEPFLRSLFKYLREEVADLVDVILLRFLGDDHTVYKYFVKAVAAIRPEREEEHFEPPSGGRVAYAGRSRSAEYRY